MICVVSSVCFREASINVSLKLLAAVCSESCSILGVYKKEGFLK